MDHLELVFVVPGLPGRQERNGARNLLRVLQVGRRGGVGDGGSRGVVGREGPETLANTVILLFLHSVHAKLSAILAAQLERKGHTTEQVERELSWQESNSLLLNYKVYVLYQCATTAAQVEIII